MTFQQVWTYLRWPLAILGLLAIVQYALPRLPEALAGMIEFDPSGSILAPEDDATPSEDALDVPVADLGPAGLEPGTGPVTDGVAAPIADFTVDDTVADIDTESLALTEDPADAVVIAFDIPPGDPGCFAGLALDLTADQVTTATEVGIYASSVDDPIEVVDNQLVEGDLRASPAPMAVVLVEAAGTVSVDLTVGFQQYFTQGFPAGRPFVLTLAPTGPVEPGGGASFTSANAESEASPALRWTGTPGCGGDPAAGATPAATPS